MSDSIPGKKVVSEPLPGAKRGVRSIAGYHLLAKIGRDDMATLYLARPDRPAKSDERVTIRQINERLSGDLEFVDAFVSETRVAEKIEHPNVASILDVGKTGGRLFVVTEYVHGENLSDVLNAVAVKHTRFPWTHGVKIIADVAEGLHAAHASTESGAVPLRIVHRDVCPKNILVGYDGQVKITDFGLAYAALKKVVACLGILKDKVGYWSPEQAEGGQLDHRSDIFSLGIVLFEAVTGRRLFDEPSKTATLLKVRRAEVPEPRSVNPDLPEDLEQVILKALARHPEDRFATAREMSDRLVEVLTRHGKVIGYRQISDALAYFFRPRRESKERLIQAAVDRIDAIALGAEPLDTEYVVEVGPVTGPVDAVDADEGPAASSVGEGPAASSADAKPAASSADEKPTASSAGGDPGPEPAGRLRKELMAVRAEIAEKGLAAERGGAAKKDFGADRAEAAGKSSSAKSPPPLRRVMTPSMKGQVMPATGSAVSASPDTGMTGAIPGSPRRQVRHLFTGVIAVGLFVAVAFGAVMLGRTLTGKKKKAASSEVKKVRTVEPMKEKVPARVRPSPTKDVVLEVSIRPKEASPVATWRGEAHHGTTVKFVMRRSNKPERVRVEAQGYKPEVVVVVPVADTKLEVVLKPATRRAPTRRGGKGRKGRKGRKSRKVKKSGRIIDPF